MLTLVSETSEEQVDWLLVMLVTGCYGIILGMLSIISTLYPLVMDAMSFSYGTVASIITATGITFLLSTLPSGSIVDRLGPKFGLALGLTLTGISNIVFSFHVSFWQMFSSYLLLGVGESIGWISIITMIGRRIPDRVMGTAYGVLTGLGTILIGLVSSVAAPILAETWNVWLPFRLFGVLSILFAVLSQVLIDQCRNNRVQSSFALDRSVLIHPGLWLYGLIGLCYSYSMLTVLNFTSVCLVDELGVSVVKAGMAVMLLRCVGAIACIVGGLLGDKIGVLRTVMIACFVSSDIAILSLIRFFYQVGGILPVYVATSLVFLGPMLAYGPYYKLIPQIKPRIASKDIGLAISMVNVVQWVSMILAPAIGGVLLDFTEGNYTPVWLLASLLSMVGATLCFPMRRYAVNS